jgi:glutaminase
MGAGPNYVLDKGLLVQGNAAVVQGTLYQGGTVVQSATPHTAVNQRSIGVAMENVDATKVAQGKVFADFRIMGIARVIASGAISAYTRVAPDATGKAVAHVSGTTTACGIALTASTNAGDMIDVLLTPGLGTN